MFNLQISFDSPWFLLLLGLIPLIWYWSYGSLAGLGRYRRLISLVLRSLVLLLMILAVANLQILRKHDRLTVIYLLDQSSSIPAEQREAMVDYVLKEVERHRDDARQDRASVIVFGREANIEVPPLDDRLPIVDKLETTQSLRRDATNLESAMKLAQATFPEDSSRRVVIVSDGNQNIGDARAIARQLADDGVGIDVVPIWLSRNADVALERVALPGDIRRGQPFEARVVVNNATIATADASGEVAGKLRVVRRHGDREETLDEAEVTLPPGKSVFRFSDEIDESDFYEYQAVFVPADGQADMVSQNNRATAFTHVRGKGHVLVIEDWENRSGAGGEFRYLVERLRETGLEVTVQFTDELFSSLGELQRFDTVILANAPRSSGTSADNIQNFSDEQIEMLVRNTQQMGCGLIMMGGRNAFGAGGWANTELEKAMPVDFQIRNAKIQAVGALAMVMHASEIPEGNYWQKRISRKALKSLGPQDYCAVIHWDGRAGESWLWGGKTGFLHVGGSRRMMLARVDRMTPGDMPDFEPSMKMTVAAFSTLKTAAVKHMICISDGDPTPPRGTTLRQLSRLGVKVTTVAVGAHGQPGHATLQRIANDTGGKYYVVRSPSALPRIYQREARRVSRPLIVERTISPQIIARHEVLRGIDELPPLSGFVMTTIKENPLVEVPVLSPFPSDAANATLLATWNYGLGRAVAFTTDAGERWATSWTGWELYDRFFDQLVRWSMRPTGEQGNLSVATQLIDGKVRVIVDALDKNDEFLNFLDLSAAVVGPEMTAEGLSLRQTAPGRYVGEFTSEKPGSYFLTVAGGPGQIPLRMGVNVPYSAEFRDRETNRQLLLSLAANVPEGGSAGQLLDGSLPNDIDTLLTTNTFRRDLSKAVSSNYVWPWLLLMAGSVFFADVFVRRVALDVRYVAERLAALRDRFRGADQSETDEQLARLRSRKQALRDEIDDRRAATRFEPEAPEDVDLGVLKPEIRSPAEARPTSTAAGQQIKPDEQDEETFTSRLMKAKQDALKDREKRQPRHQKGHE